MMIAEPAKRDPLDLRPCTCSNSTVTQGRHGDTRGRSWCIACGGLVLEAYTQPCRECRHFRPDARSEGRVGSCALKRMGVTADMRVTYYVRPQPPARHGLCFEVA